MSIYTRTGDNGQTSIFGGMKCPKDDIRVECNGMLDEANCEIGILRTLLGSNHDWQNLLYKIQVDTMDMMSHIATPSEKRAENFMHKPQGGAEFCEKWIDSMVSSMGAPSNFFLVPGGNQVSSQCHVVRARIRTAERRLVSLHRIDPVDDYILKYVNRLSDLFFVMARFELVQAGFDEERLRPFKLPNQK